MAVSTARLFGASWADADTRCHMPCLSLRERRYVLRPGSAALGTRATRPQGGHGGHLRMVWDVMGDGRGLTETGNDKRWKALAVGDPGEDVRR